MTTAQVVKTSVTVNNSSIQDFTHPDDHAASTLIQLDVQMHSVSVTIIHLESQYSIRPAKSCRPFIDPVAKFLSRRTTIINFGKTNEIYKLPEKFFSFLDTSHCIPHPMLIQVAANLPMDVANHRQLIIFVSCHPQTVIKQMAGKKPQVTFDQLLDSPFILPQASRTDYSQQANPCRLHFWPH